MRAKAVVVSTCDKSPIRLITRPCNIVLIYETMNYLQYELKGEWGSVFAPRVWNGIIEYGLEPVRYT